MDTLISVIIVARGIIIFVVDTLITDVLFEQFLIRAAV